MRAIYIAGICLLCLLAGNGIFTATPAYAQKKADSTMTVHPQSKLFEMIQTDSGAVNKLIGEVRITQGTDTLYCDSAYQNTKNRNFEAFGNVRIAQAGGTQGTSDYLHYVSDRKMAYMRGNVSLTDGKNRLWCEELTYDVGSKLGTFTKNGTLQTDSTTVSSTEGVYNGKNKDARFKGDVIVTDARYNVRSQDLMYNSETKLITFYPPYESVVTSDSSILHTTNGTYDSKAGLAHFVGRSNIVNKAQYMEADTINYNKVTGYGNARGHVISIDTAQHSTMYAGYAEYNQKTGVLWATKKPVLKQMNGKDSLFIRADTFYSAHMRKKGDTVSIAKATVKATKPGKKKGKNIAAAIIPAIDTTNADTTAPRIFIGYRHVLIFSDSLQGKCDSVSYTQADSTIRMMIEPVAWSHNSQITGDTILLHLDSNRLKDIYVPNNALLVSQSGPVKAKLFDQVQGKTLTGFFKNNAITKMIVFPAAESIYFPRDKDSAYIGVDQLQSEKLTVNFKDQQISTIVPVQEVHTVTTPMDKADLPNMRLSRFKWLEALRPKTREELFQ